MMEYLGVLMGLVVGYFGNHFWTCYQNNVCFNKRHRNKSQIIKVKEHLESGRSLTSQSALQQYGIKNVSTYIHELRSNGMEITTNKSGRFGVYTLNK